MTSPHRYKSGRGKKGNAHRDSKRRGRQSNLGIRTHGEHPVRDAVRALVKAFVSPPKRRKR
jgi:hypothetical protein